MEAYQRLSPRTGSERMFADGAAAAAGRDGAGESEGSSMSVEDLIGPDEAVLLETRPHAVALAPAFGRAIGIVTLCAVATFVLQHSGLPFWRLGASLFAVTGALAVARAIRSVFSWDRTVFAVTARHVVVQQGGLPSSSVTLPLESVERLRVDQSLLGRLLGYGTVILATGRSRRGFEFVPRPREVHGLIVQLKG